MSKSYREYIIKCGLKKSFARKFIGISQVAALEADGMLKGISLDDTKTKVYFRFCSSHSEIKDLRDRIHKLFPNVETRWYMGANTLLVRTYERYYI